MSQYVLLPQVLAKFTDPAQTPPPAGPSLVASVLMIIVRTGSDNDLYSNEHSLRDDSGGKLDSFS
jgi:hypothetical protein